jgi:hypothetical protein
MGKILCFLGWHRWTWKLSDVGYVSLNENPPDFARCERCDARYEKQLVKDLGIDELKGQEQK